MATRVVHPGRRSSHDRRHGPRGQSAPHQPQRRSGFRGAPDVNLPPLHGSQEVKVVEICTDGDTPSVPSRPATAASSLGGGSRFSSGSRPGTSVSLRLESRLQANPRVPSRPSTSSGRKTIARPGWKTRPTSTLTAPHRGAQAREKSPARSGRNAAMTSEGESDAEDARSPAAQNQMDILDFGGVDIYAENGWDTDLEEEPEVKEAFDVTGRTVYMESCKNSGIIPASYFLRHMQDQHLKMKHHGLGPKGVKPIAVALVSNTQVLQLNLADNWLGSEGGRHLCDMLRENCYIYELDLTDNQLSTSFAESFATVLNNNSTLTHITLSGNFLDDKSAVNLAEAIASTTRVEYLNLSRNKLGEVAGAALGPAIAENSSIKHLDLSWNHLRRKGAICVAQGVKNNVLLQILNLSWNGVGNEGAKALGDALKINSSLLELDITNNRIMTEGSVLLGRGITKNESLKVLKIGRNPMQSAGCYAICAAMLKNQNSLLQTIDFSDIMVNTDFGDILNKVRELHPDLKVRTGGDGVPLRNKAKLHPLLKLRNYIDRNEMRLVDFFNEMDKDRSMGVTREEFQEGIVWIEQQSGLKMSEEDVGTLLEELDKDRDGEVNYSEALKRACERAAKREFVMGTNAFTEKEKKMADSISAISIRANNFNQS